MYLDVVFAVDESKHVIARNRMTAWFEDVCINIVVGDVNRFLAVEILRHDCIALGSSTLLFLYIVFFLAKERHILAPSTGSLTLLVVLALQFVEVLVAQDDGLVAQCLEQLLVFLHFMQSAEFVHHGEGEFHRIAFEELVEYLLAARLHLPTLSAQDSLNLGLRLCSRHKVYPRLLHVLRL